MRQWKFFGEGPGRRLGVEIVWTSALSLEFVRTSSSNLGHLADTVCHSCFCLVILQGMAFWFVEDGLPDCPLNLDIGAALAEQGLQVGLMVVEQTGSQASLRGEAESVALIAEMMADGTDKANLSRPPIRGGQPIHPRRPFQPGNS